MQCNTVKNASLDNLRCPDNICIHMQYFSLPKLDVGYKSIQLQNRLAYASLAVSSLKRKNDCPVVINMPVLLA